MARRQTPESEVPHLHEAHRLAQVIVRDRRQVDHCVASAFDRLSNGPVGRFRLLRSVFEVSRVLVTLDPPSTSEPETGTPPPDREEAANPGAAPDASPAAASPVSPLATATGRTILERLLPSAFGSMDPAYRGILWLDATDISAPADGAAVTGLPVPMFDRIRNEAREQLTAAVLALAHERERPLIRSSLAVTNVRESLRSVIEPILEPVPGSLRRQLARRAERPEHAPAKRSEPRPGGFRRAALIGLIIIGTAAIGYAIQSFRKPVEEAPRSRDVVELAIDAAGDLSPLLRTSSAEQAEVFIRDRLGWRVVVPSVEGRILSGIGIAELAGGLELPVLLYGGGGGDDELPVFVLSYAFLDRMSGRVSLERAILDQVAEEGRFSLVDTGSAQALVFRNQDDLFIAVSGRDARPLQDAIRFPL